MHLIKTDDTITVPITAIHLIPAITEDQLQHGYPRNNASYKPWYHLHTAFYMALTRNQFYKYQRIGKWLPYMSGSEILTITKSKKLIDMWIKARQNA